MRKEIDDPMLALFAHHPDLKEALDSLCNGQTWCLAGSSALIVDDEDNLYFELTKPKHWTRRDDGSVVIGIGAIGGALEADEQALESLHREVAEELKTTITVESAATSHIVFEQDTIKTVAGSPSQAIPRPTLLTVSENIYRQQVLPQCDILAIATYQARLGGEARLGDVFGLLVTPRACLNDILQPDSVMAQEIRHLPGVRMMTRNPLPPQAHLAPVWTVHSLQTLLRAGLL
jgi:hypothetical protein